MVASAAQPTILVKKADGSSVRVSLAEFKKMRAGEATPATTAPAPTASRPAPEPEPEKLLIDPTEKELPAVAAEVKPPEPPAPPAPPKPVFKPRVAAPPIPPKPIQEKPLLDETITAPEVRDPGMTSRPPAITDTVVREVIRESGLVVANDLWGRTQALLLSWLRGIRGDEQFTEYATAAIDKGGLGITPAAAAELIKIMRGHKQTADNKPAPIMPIVATAPASVTTPAPKPAAPVTMQAPVQKPAPVAVPVPAPAPAVELAPSRPAPLPSSSANVFQDVRREATTTPLTGPAEEMSTFTMADWRRLGATPDAAQTALLAKFAGWRGESFLLFMDAFTAWQDSPVMRQYQEIAVMAINQRQSVSAVIAARAADRLSPSEVEFMAINNVNHELAM